MIWVTDLHKHVKYIMICVKQVHLNYALIVHCLNHSKTDIKCELYKDLNAGYLVNTFWQPCNDHDPFILHKNAYINGNKFKWMLDLIISRKCTILSLQCYRNNLTKYGIVQEVDNPKFLAVSSVCQGVGQRQGAQDLLGVGVGWGWG